ncbi:hypothetical protein BOTCAL_0654g00020 [Botryotinia calthae]|uniref:Uncharacterized protein n=1 Tax=Botryotinia calthae TaxID=38488 RepID=A0A4Y8CHQ8_9HELO|nr:hypothetical protein BOTCAL_0654g00020 [Botryotinia calthae]
MPPKRRPPPRSRSPSKSKKSKLDNSALKTLLSTTASVLAANDDLSFVSASAKNEPATSDNQLFFETEDNALRMSTQKDRVKWSPPGYTLCGYNTEVKNGPNNQQNPFNYERKWQANYGVKDNERAAQEIKSKEEKISSKPARKKRYNTAKRRAAKFNFPTEIIRLIFRCLIFEHQAFEDDFCTAVCFALTCRPHWIIFRSIHNSKISLLVQAPRTFNHKKSAVPYRLGDLLINWMLPQYRPLKCIIQDGKVVLEDTVTIKLFVSFAAYPKVGGKEDRGLESRIYEYKHNCFSKFYCIYQGIPYVSKIIPEGLNWFIPNPFRMGLEWYPATIRILKQTIFGWNSDCHLDKDYHWLTTKEEYTRHYQVWSIYKGWMGRDWVEAQPEAMAYKRSRGLVEDKKKIGMRDGFEMLKLVDVQSVEHKRRVKEVVSEMLKMVRNQRACLEECSCEDIYPVH